MLSLPALRSPNVLFPSMTLSFHPHSLQEPWPQVLTVAMQSGAHLLAVPLWNDRPGVFGTEARVSRVTPLFDLAGVRRVRILHTQITTLPTVFECTFEYLEDEIRPSTVSLLPLVLDAFDVFVYRNPRIAWARNVPSPANPAVVANWVCQALLTGESRAADLLGVDDVEYRLRFCLEWMAAKGIHPSAATRPASVPQGPTLHQPHTPPQRPAPMASPSSAPLSNIPRERLCQLVEQHGRDLWADPRRCEAFLWDYCADFRREVNLLMIAMRERVPDDMAGSKTGVPFTVLLPQLGKRLQDHAMVTPEGATWAVTSWALALGAISDVQETASSPEPASNPVVLPYRSATLQRRSVAFLVDSAIVFFCMLLLGAFVPGLGNIVVSTGVWLIYFASQESSRYQGTFGKRLCRIVVTDISGQRVSFKQAIVRSVGKLLSVVVAVTLCTPLDRHSRQSLTRGMLGLVGRAVTVDLTPSQALRLHDKLAETNIVVSMSQ